MLLVAMLVNIPISIHALREEGDTTAQKQQQKEHLFLSTPSARRATVAVVRPGLLVTISIHALREEGDVWQKLQ